MGLQRAGHDWATSLHFTFPHFTGRTLRQREVRRGVHGAEPEVRPHQSHRHQVSTHGRDRCACKSHHDPGKNKREGTHVNHLLNNFFVCSFKSPMILLLQNKVQVHEHSPSQAQVHEQCPPQHHQPPLYPSVSRTQHVQVYSLHPPPPQPKPRASEWPAQPHTLPPSLCSFHLSHSSPLQSVFSCLKIF